jgi:drug/metabolite transporter (DMT)-like permease
MRNARAWGAVVELLIAAGLWGFGFIASVWALEVVNPFELTLLRFVLAGLIGLPFVLTKQARASAYSLRNLSFVPAVLLASTLIFQTWGLQYTSPTKSGFITTLYVVFVPLLEAFLTRKRIPGLIWLCVATALIGTALMVDLGISELNRGDVLTFICAILATGQIYWMGGVSPKVTEPFAFNIYQCYWAMLMCLPLVNFARFHEALAKAPGWSTHAWIGIVSLSLGSTVIAFYLQVRAQAKLSPTVSSLMFLLESPFALLFSLLLLGQSLAPLETVGAVLIFVSAFTATWVEARGRKKHIAFHAQSLKA